MISKALKGLTRRDLLRSGLILGGGITAGSSVGLPSILEQVVYAAVSENVKNRETIIMVQLAGGNDGLNTVIPVNDGLVRRRGGFGQNAINSALRLNTANTPAAIRNNEFALHQSLRGIQRRWEQGDVAILMDVGYPMMSKSHFVGTQIWQRADPTQRELSGAFGRVADLIDDQGHPLAFCGCGYNTVPGLMRPKAQGQVAVVPTNTALFGFKGSAEQQVGTLWKQGVPGVYGEVLSKYMTIARESAAQVKGISQQFFSKEYEAQAAARGLVYRSKNNLSDNLRVAAALIKGGTNLTVATTTLGGYDDHSDEADRQGALHTLFDTAVDDFLKDCEAAGKFPTVAIYSEFGRTIGINNSAGTDHGQASPMIVVGKNVKGGVYGTMPNLNGYDVPYQIDFRSMYASLIEHLGVDAKLVVGNFPAVPFMRPPGSVVATPVAPGAPVPSMSPKAGPKPSLGPKASPSARPSARPSVSPSAGLSPKP